MAEIKEIRPGASGNEKIEPEIDLSLRELCAVDRNGVQGPCLPGHEHLSDAVIRFDCGHAVGLEMIAQNWCPFCRIAALEERIRELTEGDNG